ncbi:hypothetical protein EJ05DRAFT_104607 [Pseudovirgaria hyperparasitica]|uniref:Uncharacterized protein n=1 Tax=Pseudovirgaria hyperparasitica TaxID=470096 RepID=A0A6A6W097_9PEZI|nr:uncharacterized protein EJ05DRAFT_104607 [Pseudovirgaria hyperparasitica]KAF2755516.1 hypothetical protein EJ05DRAFT_104607 [Pseudovirgaria hyperparasitica]
MNTLQGGRQGIKHHQVLLEQPLLNLLNPKTATSIQHHHINPTPPHQSNTTTSIQHHHINPTPPHQSNTTTSIQHHHINPTPPHQSNATKTVRPARSQDTLINNPKHSNPAPPIPNPSKQSTHNHQDNTAQHKTPQRSKAKQKSILFTFFLFVLLFFFFFFPFFFLLPSSFHLPPSSFLLPSIQKHPLNPRPFSIPKPKTKNPPKNTRLIPPKTKK